MAKMVNGNARRCAKMENGKTSKPVGAMRLGVRTIVRLLGDWRVA